jgi:hypothetical protein
VVAKSKAGRALSHAGVLLATLALAGCASIGGLSARPTGVDFGGPAELRVCLLRDPDVSEARVAELMTAWSAELAPLGITVTVPWTREWPRPAFTGRGLGEAIAREPLEPGCDRLLAFIGRHAGDAVYAVAGFFLSAPEIFGWVDNVTMTRGFVVATWSPSLGQALTGGPAGALIHEGYHLLGCLHEPWAACYATIARLKRHARSDFFPSQGDNGWMPASREAANAAVAAARWEW